MDQKSKSAVGFDLGTTYSAVAFCKDGKAEVISNPDGRKTTPSVVAFNNKDRVVGSQAIIQGESSQGNVIFDSKRLVGRMFNEDSVQEDMKNWPFKVKKDGKGRAVVVYSTRSGEKEVSPEEIGATILKELKSYAENNLEHDIKDCVITCPASFNDAQRQATMNAAKIAGLHCMRLINEPTAAAVAYGVSKDRDGQVLIFDFGGGTFDATVLAIKEGTFEVRATGGDAHCGGKDLDNIMIDHIMNHFNKNRTSGRVDINDDKHLESKKKLAKEVEAAKISLSSVPQTNLFVGSFVQGNGGKYLDLSMKLSRITLEKLAKPLVEKAIRVTEDLLRTEDISKSDIDKTVLVGGFTKMPFVREQLKKMFGQDRISLGVNADEAVALGAAMMAEVLSGEDTEGKGLPTLLIDVTSLALGIELENGTMSKIIQANTPIPTVMEEKYTTSLDRQSTVKIQVYQGNRPFVKDNKKLGCFKLEGIPPMERGQPDIGVCFEISEDGVLTITANERSSGTNQTLTIAKEKVGGLTQKELDQMIEDAENFSEFDRQKKEMILEKENLERWMAEHEDSVPGNVEFSNKLKDVSDWLENDSDKKTQDLVKKRKMLEAFLSEDSD